MPIHIRPLATHLVTGALLIGLATSTGQAVSTFTGDAIAIVDVTVIPMAEGGSSRRSQTVVVQGDQIVEMGLSREITVPAGARIIDGRGRFLMPGLCDMHVHVEDASELTLYGAYGVTTVLNMRGLPCHLRWKKELADGDRFGPTLYTTGDYVDGHPATMSPMMSFRDDAAIRASIARQKAEGYDLVKVYAELSPDQLEVVGDAAQANGLAVVGHTSSNYSLEHALGSGQVNVAHIDQLFRFLDGPRDEANERAIARSLRDAGATVTTTIAIYIMIARHFEDLDAILAQPEARRLHPALLQPWRRENHRFLRRGEAGYERQLTRNAELRRFAKFLHDEGVDMVLGTDASTVGAYPGWSVYEELRELVAAGLTPYEALATATAHAGRFVRRHVDPEARFGRIATGYRANLVLLEEDPLTDVDHVRDPLGVMIGGTWYPRSDLAQRLASVEEANGALSPAVLSFERMIGAGNIDGARAVFDETRQRVPRAMLFQHYWLYFRGFGYLYDDDGVTDDPEKLRIATGLYEMYAETFPDYHSAHYMLGRAYAASGQRAKAIQAFEAALAICPGYAYAEEELAELSGATSLEWAKRDSLVGYWSGAYQRLDSVLPVNVRIERDADGGLQCYEEYPDWIYYGWLGPKPIVVGDDGVITLPARDGQARLIVDSDYREMIGPVDGTAPPMTLHLKRAVPPPRIRSTEEPAQFASDVPLQGTLVLPEGPAPHPCVVMLHGRGCSDRSRLLAQGRALAQYGVAVLAFDQRGAGASDVDCGTTTFDDVVNDAEAAYRFVTAHPAIDASRVGVKGGSAGAWTAQALAARAEADASLPSLAFIATWIGPATSIAQQQRDCTRAIAKRIGLSADQLALALRQVDVVLDENMPAPEACRELRRIETIARDAGWLEQIFAPDDFPGAGDDIDRVWLRRFRFDPTEVLRRMRDTPYLAVFGEEDDVVPVDVNAKTLRSLLREAGNEHVRIVVVPGIGHSTEHGDLVRPLSGGTGSPAYYKFDRVEPRYFECLVRFLRELEIMTR